LLSRQQRHQSRAVLTSAVVASVIGGSAVGIEIGGFKLIEVFVMDGTIRVRTAAWFATAVVVSMFATLLVMQEWRADAAPGD
jgi:hypothetical protein